MFAATVYIPYLWHINLITMYLAFASIWEQDTYFTLKETYNLIHKVKQDLPEHKCKGKKWWKMNTVWLECGKPICSLYAVRRLWLIKMPSSQGSSFPISPFNIAIFKRYLEKAVLIRGFLKTGKWCASFRDAPHGTWGYCCPIPAAPLPTHWWLTPLLPSEPFLEEQSIQTLQGDQSEMRCTGHPWFKLN